jgi:DNA-binding transcriptional LysR family regulator
MRNLDIELLRTFVAVIEGESFAAAAEAISRTQSAVTQQMQRLEAQVGKTLFRRQGRGKQLTEDGHKLLGFARRLLAINEEAIFSMSNAPDTGEIRLGAPHDITENILPNVLAQCASRFPGLRISIQVGRSPFLMQALKRGELDLTIAALDAPEVEYITLRTSPIVWMCASTYRLEPGKPLQLIMADKLSFFRRAAIRALDDRQIPWRLAYTSSTLAGVRAALKAGLGVTARSVEMLSSDMRVLGEAEGLPRLPDVSFRLFLASHQATPLARRVFDSLEHCSF